MIIKEIIEEAVRRANLVPRRQTVPGNLLETGLHLLKGITSRYNNQNYLAFTQGEVKLRAVKTIHVYDIVDTFGGDDNVYFDSVEDLQNPLNIPTVEQVEADTHAMVKGIPGTVYVAVSDMPTPRWDPRPFDSFDPRDQQMAEYATASHVHVKDVTKLNTLMVTGGNPSDIAMTKLAFTPLHDFRQYQNNYLGWSYNQLAEGEWVIYTKPYTAGGSLCYRLQYNRGFHYDIDTDIRIPDAYIELLTVALTYALASEYPRLDDAHMQRLAKTLADMEDNVKTPKADSREIRRDMDGTGGMDGTLLLKGQFLY